MSAATVIHLRVPGPPTGKARPRFDTRTGRTYTPTATVNAEQAIRAAWQDQGEPRLPDEYAVGLDLLIVVERPQCHYRRDGKLTAEGLRHPVPRNRKPDIDNAVKLVCDALNGRAYRDDVMIADLTARRRWGDRAETVIVLTALLAVDLALLTERAA